MSKKILELLKNTCYESFCSALVQDINWDELKIAEKVFKCIIINVPNSLPTKLINVFVLVKYNKL